MISIPRIQTIKRRRTRAGGGRSGGFTLIELLTVIAIIVILLAILIPVVAKARQVARQSACAGQMRQIGIALTGYCAENRGELPGYRIITDKSGTFYGLNRQAGPQWWTQSGKPTRDFVSHLLPYFTVENAANVTTGVAEIMLCPASPSATVANPEPCYYLGIQVRKIDGTLARPFGYGTKNTRSIRMSDIAQPASAVALFDLDAPVLALLSQGAISTAPTECVHGHSRNVLYFDGHVASVDSELNPHESL